MCLCSIDKENKDWKIGYKVFTNDNSLLGLFYNKRKPRLPNKWLHEKDFRGIKVIQGNIYSEGIEYPVGWHVFRNLEDAKKYNVIDGAIRKVLCRGVVATGIQRIALSDTEVGVFKEIFIQQ